MRTFFTSITLFSALVFSLIALVLIGMVMEEKPLASLPAIGATVLALVSWGIWLRLSFSDSDLRRIGRYIMVRLFIAGLGGTSLGIGIRSAGGESKILIISIILVLISIPLYQVLREKKKPKKA